jgi:phospholipid-binding lipoprotein MlaA
VFFRLIVATLLLNACGYGLHTPSVFAQLGAEEADLSPPPDPLEPFNQAMFTFNLKLDEYALRPVATGYATVLPVGARRGVDRFFRNLGIVERFANNLFQLRLVGAGRELSRFAINTTLGGVGFFDVADDWFGIKPSPADFGQTMWRYGMASGPYLVLPFYGPSTIRDAVGRVADGAMNPINYLLPTWQVFAIRGGTTAADAVNYRSLNLEFFEDVDRFSVDLYGAVQDGYLQRRERQLREE